MKNAEEGDMDMRKTPNTTDFVAIDVETANSDQSSICQIGIARFHDGKLAEEWKSMVNPEDYFDDFYTRIHGISELSVAGQPKFSALVSKMNDFLDGAVCVSHSPFDRNSINRAADKHKVSLRTPLKWLDSSRVAKIAWKERGRQGYGLKDICCMLGYKFKHHDALEDAKACGHVLLAAIEKTGTSLDGWLKRVNQPISPSSAAMRQRGKIVREGDPDGALHGEVMVFTGSLEMPRKEAADMAHGVGCGVEANVTKKTTLLVLGDQDFRKLRGNNKSGKHKKAERFAAGGQPIRIITEGDFFRMIEDATR